MSQFLKAERTQFQPKASMNFFLKGQGKETRKAMEEISIMLKNVHQRPNIHVKFGLTEIKWG